MVSWRGLLPSGWVLAIIILIAVASHLTGIYLSVTEPHGKSYSYSLDELGTFAVANSYKWGFLDPYGAKSNTVFENPVLGSVYLFAVVGVISGFLTLDVALSFGLLYIIARFSYMIVIYHVIGLFLKTREEKNIAFMFMAFVVGSIGGILYLAASALDIAPQNVIVHLLDGGGSFFGIDVYHGIALVTGYLSFLFFAKYNESQRAIGKNSRNFLVPSVLLGITVAVYPLFAAAFLGIIFIYSIIHKRMSDFARILPAVFVFSLLWIVPYISNQSFYKLYLIKADYVNPLAFLVFSLFIIPPAVYWICSSSKSKFDRSGIFLIAWSLFVLALTLMPPGILPMQPQRFLPVVWLPLSIMASAGFFMHFRKKAVWKYVFLAAVLLSLPTLLLWIGVSTEMSREKLLVSDSYLDALYFLKAKDPGIVLASPDIGMRVPYYAEKRSLLSSVPSFDTSDLLSDYNTFYSSVTTRDKKADVLRKYDISYVILGPEERKVGNPDLENIMERIGSFGEVDIYKIRNY